MRSVSRWLAVAASLAAVLAAWPAAAWEPLRATSSGVPAHWEIQTIPWERANAPADLPAADVDRLLRDAFATWAAVPCHLLTFVELPPEQGPGLALDGHNRIRFVNVGWFGTPAEVAITSTTIHDETGRIVDADMALNDEGYELADGVGLTPDAVDLGGVLTHELGHFLGLGHSADADATMRAYLPGEEVAHLRTLAADDEVGLCSLYEPGPTLTVEEGRATDTQPGAAPVMLAGLGVALLAARRRGSMTVAAALAVALAGASPRCTDAGVIVDATAGADTAVDGGPGGDGAADVAPDTTGGVDAATLLASEAAWTITRIETLEEPGFPADPTLDLTDAQGAVVLAFDADGTVARARADAQGVVCSTLGTWEATGDQITLSFPTTARFCPSVAPRHEESLRVERDAVTGAPVLVMLASPTSVGNSGRGIRPYRATLSPAPAAPDRSACPAPPAPVACALTCAAEGDGLARTPVYALACGTGAPVCTVVLDPGTGGVARRECVDGCQTVVCDLNPDGSGACAAEPAGVDCSWTSAP